MPLPNLLIAGCQKSGTTWLHHALRRSRHFLGSKVKELNYFNRKDYLDRQEEYEANFPLTEGVSYYFESTPHYYRLPQNDVDIAARIAGLLGKPELIVLFRNPVDRYESAYIHHIMRERLPMVETIEDVVDDFGMIEFGRYATITEHWQSILGPAHYYLYEDLDDKPALIQSVMSALSLDNDLEPERLEFGVNKKVVKADRLGWTTMPRLGDTARAKLHEIYAPEVDRLGRMLGRDLSAWQTPRPAAENPPPTE